MSQPTLDQRTADDVRMDTTAIRILVRSREDFQDVRKRIDNRLGRKANGKLQEVPEREMHLDDFAHFCDVADAARASEDTIQKLLKPIVERFPIYERFLSQVRGLSVIGAGWIIGEFDIHIATTVSKMWQFAGMNSGLVRGKKWVEKKDARGKVVMSRGRPVKVKITTDTMIRGDKLTKGFCAPYNRDLRRALLGIVADNMVKHGSRFMPTTEEEWAFLREDMRKRVDDELDGDPLQRVILSPYLKIYYDRKWRQSHSSVVTVETLRGGATREVEWRSAAPAHRDSDARRIMMKHFIADLYREWRVVEGLEVRPPYQEEYLGHKHEAA